MLIQPIDLTNKTQLFHRRVVQLAQFQIRILVSQFLVLDE